MGLNHKIVFSTCLVICLALSVYFTAAAAAQSIPPSYLPLMIYRLGSDGRPTPVLSNVFSSGDSVWLRIPQEARTPFSLEAYNYAGTLVWNRQESSLPSDNLLNLLLTPTSFPPTNPYSVILRAYKESAPGLVAFQAYRADFLIVPAAASLSVDELERDNGSVRFVLTLLDRDKRPKAGVRVGFFLREGESSLPLTTEATDGRGRAALQIGGALGPGSYSIEGRVLDHDAVSAPPLEISRFTIEKAQTQVFAWETQDGLAKAVLRESGTLRPVPERLTLLEQRLEDGNWTVYASSYTNAKGESVFAAPSASSTWRIAFKGDTFYEGSSSDLSSPFQPSPGRVQPSCRTCCVLGGPSPMAVDPQCGGGGGGGPTATTTTLYLPSSAYATIPAVLKAQVKTSGGTPLAGLTVNFYNGTTSIGSGTTNSTGYAVTTWTPRISGSQTIKAEFTGTSGYSASSDQKVLSISKTPTVVMILQPKPLAYAWDLARPVAVTIVTLELAASGDGSPAKIYIPPYAGSSTTPSAIPGFGWRGLNSTLVTVKINGTSPQNRTMDWTRNFYLPACPNPDYSNPTVYPCPTTPRTGHLNITASLSPPNSLYSSSSTKLNVPYQIVKSVSASSNQLTQEVTAPRLYVKVNGTLFTLTVKMQDLPVSLALYAADFALNVMNFTAPPGGTTTVSLPASSTFAYVARCQDAGCTSTLSAANLQLGLWKQKNPNFRELCAITTANDPGIANLEIHTSDSSCTWPYDYVSVPNTGTFPIKVEIFRTEAVSRPSTNPLYTNFEGYNYALHIPQNTGRYLINAYTYLLQSPYTLLYPAASYPDIKWPSRTGAAAFVYVEKHPIKAQTTLEPEIPTILDSVTATVQIYDEATSKPMSNNAFSYALNRLDPNPGPVVSGSFTTNVNGTGQLSFGSLAYGNYTIQVSRAANATHAALSASFSFTVYKAKPTLIISPSWIENAIAGQTYTFRTSLVNNITQTLIAVSGLTERVYVNEAFYASYTTNSGGNVTFSWTPAVAGQYKIEVKLDKQSYYTASSVTIVVSVARRSVVLAVDHSPLDPDISQSITWDVYAYDMINNATVRSLPVSQYVNGLLATTRFTDSSGHATFTYTFSSRGFHNVTFASAQNATYNSAVSYRPLTAFVRTSLTLQAGTIVLGQQNTLTTTLKDAGGTPLPGKLIRVEIGGAFYTNITTDSNGQAQFTWRPENAGTFSVVARFSATASGDLGYRASSNTLTVNIVLQTTTNTDIGTGGTQSVPLQSGTGQPVQSGLKVSIEFPSLGTLVVKIEYNGRFFQGSLHIWNEFGANCVAWVFGQCVFAVPYWRVHFDGTFNTAMFQFVIDFFSGAIISQNAGGPFATVDPKSQAFGYGATAVDLTLAAASTVFFAVLFASTGAGEPAAGPAAVAAMLAFALGFGLAGFLAYQDKASRLNMLGGMLAEFGIGVVRYFVRIAGISVPVPLPCCNQLIPGIGAAWGVFWGIVAGSTPWTRVVLLTGLLTFFLAVLQVFLMVGFFV